MDKNLFESKIKILSSISMKKNPQYETTISLLLAFKSVAAKGSIFISFNISAECMRKIKLYIASSLDSYIAGENGSIDWLFSDGHYGYDTILVGRKTYDQSLTFEEYPYKGKKVYVFTRSTEEKENKNVTYDVEYIDVRTFLALPGF